MSDGTPPPPHDGSHDSTADDAAQPSAGANPPEPPAPGGQTPGTGWGTPPPPPPPGQPAGWGAAPPPPPGAAGQDAYNAPAAIGYGWNKFKANPGPLLLGTLVLMVVAGVVSYVTDLVASGLFFSDGSTVVSSDGTISINGGSGFLARVLVSMLVSLVVGLVAQLILAALVKGALDTVDGKPVSVGTMFDRWDKGAVLIAALIVSVATAIGTLLCYLPGLVVGFLTSYTMFFVVDRGMAPLDAVKASVSFVTANLSNTLVYYLLGVLVVIAGALLCGVGLLAAIPIVILGAAYTFRRLHDQPVVPA